MNARQRVPAAQRSPVAATAPARPSLLMPPWAGALDRWVNEGGCGDDPDETVWHGQPAQPDRPPRPLPLPSLHVVLRGSVCPQGNIMTSDFNGTTPTGPATTDAAPAWINDLSPAQLALARIIQQNGLEGRPVELRGFAWYMAGEVLVTTPQQSTLSAAFDLSVQSLPCAYTQQPPA